MANEIKFVLGSTTTAISHAATLASAGWTYSGMPGCTMTNVDNSTALYPHARAVLSVPDTFGGVPVTGAVVGLYMLPNDVDGTSDDTPAPDSAGLKAARYVGTFQIPAYDVATRITIDLPEVLAGITSAQFFIENKTGQSLVYASTAITVKITPYTYAPT